MKRRFGITIFSVAVIVLAFYGFLLMRQTNEPTTVGNGVDAHIESQTTHSSESARHKRTLARKRIEAILEGKWIRRTEEKSDKTGPRLYAGPCRIVSDDNGDGVPDSISINVYDDDGTLVASESDEDGDGIANGRSETHYNEFGDQISIITNGKVLMAMDYTYDNDGNEIGKTIDFKGDGEIDITVTSTHDAAGNPLTNHVVMRNKDQHQTLTYDDNDNLLRMQDRAFRKEKGQWETSETQYTYDDVGNLIKEVVTGDKARTITYTYDENGNRLSKVRDNGSDGRPTSIWRSRYDEAGNKLASEWDRGGDGTIDGRTSYSYDCWK